MPAWATGEADVDSHEANSSEPDSDESSPVEPSPAWQELDEPHRPDPVQIWFQDDALAVPEAEVGPPAVEDKVPLSEHVSDTATADGADDAEETGLEEADAEQTSPRELARHRRAGLVAERRAAKAERRRRRAEARLLRRGGRDRVSVPLEVDEAAEPVAADDEVLAEQEQQAEQERAEQERLEAERAEAERAEAERAEQERLEVERAEAERAEAERAEAEERAEQERLEVERAELAAAQEAEAARETEREAAEREADEQRRAEQAEAERLETEQAELEAAAEDARAKAEQAEQRERARQAKEAEREQAREAKDAERERRRAEKAERRAEKARAAAERRRDPVTETDGDPDDVPEPPDEVGSDRSTTRRSRNILPLVAGTLGALGLLFSVLLAVGAFLVAVGTDESGSLFSALATVCDALTAPLSGLISFSGENADKKEALVMWGLGAMVYLAIGLAAQSVLAKRTETTQA